MLIRWRKNSPTLLFYNGLSDNQVRTIQEDQNGVIWFGTAHGVNSYQKGIIKNHTAKNASFLPLEKEENNWKLTENDLWFNAGNKSGAYRFDGQELHYLDFPIQGEENSLNTYALTDFSRIKDDKIWISTYAAVFGFDGKEFEIIDDEYLGFTEDYKKLHIRSILEDSKGNFMDWQ